MSVNLNKTILSLRREKGYTQEQLAEMLGVSTAAVSKWECANAYPDITLIPQIAEIFDVSTDYLLGHDISAKKSISETILKANELECEQKYEQSVSLIAKMLVRYPNNEDLTFELARHKYRNSFRGKRTERDILLKQATEEFLLVSQNTENETRRAWSLQYLTNICFCQCNYEEARKYNAKLLGSYGIYPKVNQAVIEIKQKNKNAYEILLNTLYASIVEYSMIFTHLSQYLYDHNDNSKMIDENMRTIKVLSEFNDYGLFFEEISSCCECIALAYANLGDYDNCIDYLERAYNYAALNDKKDFGFIYGKKEIFGEYASPTMRVSSVKRLRQALESDERHMYDPIRNTERFIEIIRKTDTEK